MILVDHQIRALAASSCLIASYNEACLTNIGYDLRTNQFYQNAAGIDSVTLQPNESVFVESEEIISLPNDLLGRVVLKNSRIRQGLSIDVPVYQPGHKTRIYFRLTNISADSIELYTHEKYATIIFEQLAAVPERPYAGAFKDEFDFRGMGDYHDLYKRQIREIEKKADDVKSIEGTIYANVLVILTVFVALFSFLTTNISLTANSATIDQYFVFNALMLGCIGFMVALLKMVIKPHTRSWTYWIPCAIAFVAAFLLFVIF